MTCDLLLRSLRQTLPRSLEPHGLGQKELLLGCCKGRGERTLQLPANCRGAPSSLQEIPGKFALAKYFQVGWCFSQPCDLTYCLCLRSRVLQVPSAMQRPTGSTTGSYNIQTALKQGAYKRFYDAVWSVFGKSSSETADFKLPEVVVVGSESSGKSSLLESIAKCEIFPGDRSQCTRAPIRFKLMQVR